MPRLIDGTKLTVVQRRTARDALINAIRVCEVAGLPTAAMQAQVLELNDTVVLVPVPCIICRQSFPVRVRVGEVNMPYRVLCGKCDETAIDTLT